MLSGANAGSAHQQSRHPHPSGLVVSAYAAPSGGSALIRISASPAHWSSQWEQLPPTGLIAGILSSKHRPTSTMLQRPQLYRPVGSYVRDRPTHGSAYAKWLAQNSRRSFSNSSRIVPTSGGWMLRPF